MKRDEELIQLNQRLKAQNLELASANEALKRELDEQKHAMEALKDSAQRLRSLAAISSDWIWEQDADYRFMALTDELGDEKFGAVWSGSVGQCRWDLSGVVPLSMSWDAHRAVLDARQTFRDFEYMRVLDDALPSYFSSSGVPVFDRQNQFIGYRGVAHDISASKRAEEAQRQAFRFLDDIVDNIPIALHLRSVQDGHRVVAWNKACEALYGLTREEAMGRTLHDLWPKADADCRYAADLELIAAGVTQDFSDHAALTKHRGVIRTHQRRVPLKDASGAVTHILYTGEDITERLAAEATLRHSEERFRTVVAAMAEGVFLRDADGRIVDCNASAERIIGKSLIQMRGLISFAPEWQTLREDGSLMDWDERPSVVAMRTGLPQSDVAVGYRKPDGSVLWTLLNARPMFDGTGSTPSGFVTTVTDISKRKHAEMEIIRLNVDLETRVSRRTAQLDAANKELEAFSYSVAHDLRSPLSAIDGFSALLKKALPPDSGERAQHYLDRIRSGVRRMGELTDGLLSLAQLSRTSLNWEPVDMSAEAAKIMQEWSEKDAARLVQTSVEPGLLVRADRSLLRQALENLIANAWKFTSEKPSAEITVGRETGADQQPVYFVRDNGAGFDMAYVDKLFGTFQRLHSPEEFAGSGIGLATVKRIITRHGGRIWANSSVGEGSTFYFTLGSEQSNAASSTSEPDEESGFALAQLPLFQHLRRDTADTSPNTIAATPISSDNAFTVTDQQFSSVFEHAAIGMVLVSIDSRRMRGNSAFCQMLGYSAAEILTRSVHEITDPDDIGWDLLQRNRALAGEIETYQREKRYIHKSGRIVWAYLSCSLVRDADRRPLHFISQIQDISERKEAERILRESEERFRVLTALSSDWFWELDENFRLVKISGEINQTHLPTGSLDNAIGKTRWELVEYANMDESVWAAHKAQLERHEVFRDFQVTRLDPDGQIHYLSLSGAPIFDASGRFTGYRGTGSDTTDMHRVSDALRANELQLRDITDSMPAWITYMDAGLRFRFHNRAYEEAFGLTHEQIHGKTLREVIGDEIYEVVRPRLEEALSGYSVAYERSHKTTRGDHRDYAINSFPRYGDGDEAGQVIGLYSLATDITELKRIDRMKNEFVSTVSHELRTPLTSIRGSLGLIAGGVAGQLPEAVNTLVDIARNNCERLIRLINDILDIEKIESGKMHLELQVLDLRPLLVEALAANEGFGAVQNVGLSLHFPDENLQVNVDSDRLTQVMTNLLSNAMKFSPPGGAVEVHVSRAGIGVRIEVRDRGPGIPEEFRNQIFQKFSQADSSDTRQKGGTGLGLNISRAIVERLGGNIGFHTEVGAGTTFFFELPQWKEQPAPAVGAD